MNESSTLINLRKVKISNVRFVWRPSESLQLLVDIRAAKLHIVRIWQVKEDSPRHASEENVYLGQGGCSRLE